MSLDMAYREIALSKLLVGCWWLNDSVVKPLRPAASHMGDCSQVTASARRSLCTIKASEPSIWCGPMPPLLL